MFKKIYILSSTMLFSLVLAVSGANAVSVTPSFDAVYNYTVSNQPGNLVNPLEVDTFLDGLVQHSYAFEADQGFDTTLKFTLDYNNDFDGGQFGIENFIATWSVGGIIHVISDAFSVDQGGSPFFHTLLNGESGILALSGRWRDNGGAYALTVSAVPLPPAVIAFGTAMLGVGFLARRRRKQKATFA